MLDGDPPPKEEFMAEENVNYKKTREGAMSAGDDTVPASNLPPPPKEVKHPDTLQ
jgi:hypothetical protein